MSETVYLRINISRKWDSCELDEIIKELTTGIIACTEHSTCQLLLVS